MKIILLTVLTGIIAGIIDILPMIKMKLDKYSIFSAFIFYFMMPFVIFNIELFAMPWWLKGGTLTLALVIPVILIAAKEDRTAIPPMVITAVVLGTLIGLAGHLMI